MVNYKPWFTEQDRFADKLRLLCNSPCSVKHPFPKVLKNLTLPFFSEVTPVLFNHAFDSS